MIDKRDGVQHKPQPSKPTVLPTSEQLEKARKNQPGKSGK